ncbi:hypothetical protein GALL_259520 [mine drainage metagenome]|uniref:Uncharacterized protein n=1 Tax=mine drainage metagenome TaxID=410659 RepID=A0A1J5RRJ6_9ZZZZ
MPFAELSDARGRYCLNDVHAAGGAAQKHRLGYFLGNHQTKDLVREIAKTGIPAISAKEGRQQPGSRARQASSWDVVPGFVQP